MATHDLMQFLAEATQPDVLSEDNMFSFRGKTGKDDVDRVCPLA